MQKTCVVITGPTAVGKTDVALQLASHFSTDIISADSRQCYRELGIGVAKPEPHELAAVKHHFINSHSIHDSLTASDFENLALKISEEIFREKDFVIVAGGTGLYLRAFLRGLDPVPPAEPAIRERVEAGFREGGIQWLQDQVRHLDPLFAQQGEFSNPRRLMRALEVVLVSGRSILEFHRDTIVSRPFRIIPLLIERPREELYARINERVDEMVRKGLETEARELLPFRHLPALQTVGYSEFFSCFDGDYSPDRAVELIKQNTRQYAKRQLTWFRNQDDYVPCAPDMEKALRLIDEFPR